VSGIRDERGGVLYFCEREQEKYDCRDEKHPDEKSATFKIFPDGIGDRNDRHPKHGRYDAGESDDIHQLKARDEK